MANVGLGFHREQQTVECVRRELRSSPFWFCLDTALRHRPLFKYLPARWAFRMLNTGAVRITTLGECRDSEEVERGDREEGHRTTIGLLDGEFASAEDIPPFFRRFIGVPEGQPLTIRNSIFEHDERTEDEYYLYCTTWEFDEGVMRAFPQCDACVRIDNPAAFVTVLTYAIADRIHEAVSLRRVSYEPRHQRHGDDPPTDQHAAWVKEPRFGHQREARALWTARAGTPVTPWEGEVPGIIRHISPHYLPGRGLIRMASRGR